MSEQNAVVVNATSESFERDVIQRSREVPVVVDFWAEWCGPCRVLAPVLESLAVEFAGRFALVKVDIEAQQSLAAQFGVQSIPFVVAFWDGRPVDQFAGALPEPLLREWLERILPTRSETLTAEAAKLESSNPEEAERRLREAHALDPSFAPAQIALAQLLAHSDRLDEAQGILDELAKRGFLEPEAERVRAELEVSGVARQAGGVAAARAAVDAEPERLELKTQLADALAAEGQYQEAMDLCLEVIEKDKTGAGEAARHAMLNILNLASADADLVGTYRRKLASLLY